MKGRKWICIALCAAMAFTSFPVKAAVQTEAETAEGQRETLNFNTDWLYSNKDYENGELARLDDTGFEKVSVPHANTILTTHKGNDFPDQIASYRFVSWYRRHFTLPGSYAGRKIRVEFEGVATIADVYLNGKHLANHKGAYTGFTVDISDEVYTDGRDNVLAVRVDSQRQPEIPPEGGSVDYCLFGGIVRDVNMIVTDPVYVERTFVTTPGLTDEGGVVNTQVDVRSDLKTDKTYTVETAVVDKEGKTVATASAKQKLAAGTETAVEVETKKISNPHLWNLDDPYLYTLVTTVKDGDTEVDTYETTFGMRYFEFENGPDDGSLYLNGKKTEIVGINRHEQWPWIGRAVPDKLQQQDADLIKANGINAVRCSHYPQDPSFLERCDEIGLLVFEEPPGWQHIGDDEWKENFKENLRELILRDRNHPSIISWGARPNESVADLPFNRECEAISKELDPTRPTHGVRWEFALPGQSTSPDDQEVVNDILTVNYRYPENPPHIPYIVTEHSNDWGGDGMPGVSDSRAQAFINSFAEVLDYYYGNDKVAGGFGWSMFDYNNEVNYTNTGYVFYSGLYDIFRNEKPVAWLYRTQMDADESEPMVYIANNWTADTAGSIYVMSNCDEVELFVNGVSKGKIEPNKYTSMPHPIFSFEGVAYEEGELKAVGYIDGKKAGEAVRTTVGQPVRLIAVPDYDTLTADGTDMTSVSVSAVDANGNIVPFAENPISVAQKSGAETKLISENGAQLEGGRLAFLVQTKRDQTGKAVFEVTSPGLESAVCEIEIGAFQADDLVPVSMSSGGIEPELQEVYALDDTSVGTGLNQFNYQGAGWTSGPETTAYQGGNHWTSAEGDSCAIRFEGENIKYYGAKAPAHGIASFRIDDREEVLVDCYAAERQGVVLLFDSGKLSGGEHVLTVRVTGQKNADATGIYLNADKVEIAPEYEGPAAVVNDDRKGEQKNRIQYVGGNWGYTEDDICYQGDNSWSETKDEYLLFPFEGTSVKYYATVAPNHGIGEFAIDDEKGTTVDFYRAQREGQVLVYDSGQLKKGEHVLKVRVTGDKNAASQGYFVTVDKIEVYDDDAADKTELNSAVSQAEELKQTGFTKESWANLQEALADAKEILSYSRASRKAVQNAVNALKKAMEGLTATKRVEEIFGDIPAEPVQWYADAVQYVYDNKIMTGLDEEKGIFGPGEPLSRAQFTVILYRMAGGDSEKGNLKPEGTVKTFPDVTYDDEKCFYRYALQWASSVGIIGGYKNGYFGPGDNITREQMTAMMYRYAEYKKYVLTASSDLKEFPDEGKVDKNIRKEMEWAVGVGLLTGNQHETGPNTLDPQGESSRAMCAMIIQRFFEKIK